MIEKLLNSCELFPNMKDNAQAIDYLLSASPDVEDKERHDYPHQYQGDIAERWNSPYLLTKPATF